MSRQVFLYDPPDRFVAGTVGLPGRRTFFLQATAGPRVTSVALEKTQVAALAERMDELLDEVVRRSGGSAAVPAMAPSEISDSAPLDTPIEEEFRVGTMALAWDGEEQRMIVEAQALVELEADTEEDLAEAEERLLQDEENGPPMLRVRLTGAQARAFAKRALDVVNAGRPPCPLCSLPLDPEGHVCPRQNGYRRGAGPQPTQDVYKRQELLARGELAVRGRIREASNAALFCTVSHDGREASCVYKPVAGERPLWDFPDGTLAGREVAAYEVSEATGWGLVPPTVLRDGPYGEGMCQLWIDVSAESELLALVDGEEPGPGWKAIGFAEVGEGRTALLVHADDERLRRLAVLDAVINNADRKGGHLLPTTDGRLYGIDHGVAFNAENKLRTLLWGWAGEPLTADAVDVLEGCARASPTVGSWPGGWPG